MAPDAIRIVRVDPRVQERADEIMTLERECFEATPSDLLAYGCWWIAYQGDTPVAYCGMRRSFKWVNVGYFSRAGVSDPARGNGLQKRLIRVRLAHAKKLGYVCVITDTFQNPASANSLIGCGFRMYAPKDRWSYRGSCYWKKNLI